MECTLTLSSNDPQDLLSDIMMVMIIAQLLVVFMLHLINQKMQSVAIDRNRKSHWCDGFFRQAVRKILSAGLYRLSVCNISSTSNDETFDHLTRPVILCLVYQEYYQ